MVTFDLDAAKGRVQTLPWIAEASLRKLYPHDLAVVIRERRPYALWQDGDKLWLIDETGHRITDAADAHTARCRWWPGKARPNASANSPRCWLPFRPWPLTRAGILIAGRRWTVVLDSGVELMLPEDNPAAALSDCRAARRRKRAPLAGYRGRGLRGDNRVVVRLDSDAIAARAAFLKARGKAPKAKLMAVLRSTKVARRGSVAAVLDLDRPRSSA